MARTIFTLLAIGAIAICGAFFIPFGAWAQRQCAMHDVMLRALSQKHQEVPIARAITSGGNIIEILAKEDGSTWSIIVTYPSRVSCLQQAGEAWQSLAAPPPGQPM